MDNDIDESIVSEDPWWNAIVLSNAGKPIFCRYEGGHEVVICSLVQALIESASASGLGEMQFLRSNYLSIVFMTIGAITLVGVSKESAATDATAGHLLMKLRLEYLYAQIIFTMTQQVQSILIENPNYDLGEILDASSTVMRSMLADTGTDKLGPYLTGAIDVLGPISVDMRDKTSMTLLNAATETPNTVFAILLVNEQLLSIVQPSYLPHQLRPSDLRILIKFITSQPGLVTSELWSPVCLPRFNSTGFLYAYSSCLHERTNLHLILISQISETTQFDLFRNASIKIRKDLALPMARGSVLQIEEDDISGSDVAWTRLKESVDDEGNDEEYVALPHGHPHSETCPLIQEIETATDPERLAELVDEYSNIGSVHHFMFRKDVQVRGHSSKDCGTLPQSFIPPLDFPFVDAEAKWRVWRTYEKLCLRMRLGAASTASTWSKYDEILTNYQSGERMKAADVPSFQSASASVGMELTESVPQAHGMTYVIEEEFLFLAMNGKGFELYAIFPSSVPIQDATTSAAMLARTLVAESGKLLLTEPLTWK